MVECRPLDEASAPCHEGTWDKVARDLWALGYSRKRLEAAGLAVALILALQRNDLQQLMFGRSTHFSGAV